MYDLLIITFWLTKTKMFACFSTFAFQNNIIVFNQGNKHLKMFKYIGF